MRPEVIRHIEELKCPAALDVRGQWCFLPNAKTGTSAMSGEVFRTREILKHRGERNYWTVWHELFRPRMDEVFIYTFVRNPWERVVSAFAHCQQRCSSYQIHPEWKFRDWVKKVLVGKGTGINMHFAEQAPSFLLDGEIMPEVFVGRFEQIEFDWLVVADRLNVTQQLPRVNASQHEHYTQYYDDESREIVRRLYKTEIEHLGYEFGQ